MRSNLIAISGFFFFLISVYPSLAGEQAPISLDRLPEIITGAPNHRAEFTEERRVLLLTEPVRLLGTLLFRAPDLFEKHTLSPQREDLVVDGEWVTVSLPDQNTEMRFNMTDDPLLHGLLFSLQSLLNGEPGRLAGIFTIEAWGGAKAWTLRLKPSGRELAERVRVMRVTGETHWIRTIELWETSGDYLIMTIGSEVTE
ncbi:MAG: LolA-related protein [Pseudomonadota bacterium]